jgi:hypothetical protein
MALPKLRPDGTLPPGTHRVTLAELTAAFDQAGSTTRPALSAALRHAVALIWSTDPAAIIYVGGSYVTVKRDPSDLDMAVRSDVWSGTAFGAAFSAAHPNEVSLVDVFFNRIGDAQHMEDFFREIAGDPTARKGIVELIR